MEGLEFSTIFIPMDPGITQDFSRVRDGLKNNFPVRDGSHRELYMSKVIFARNIFQYSSTCRSRKLVSYQLNGALRK